MSIDPSIPPSTPPPSIPAVPPPHTASEAAPIDAPSAVPGAPEAPAAVAPAAAAAAPTDEKTIAIISYLWIIGFIIAIVMNKDNKKPGLATFHLRQMAGLLILSIGGWIVFQIIGVAVHSSTVLSMLVGLVSLGYSLALFVLWLIGFIGAINSQQKSIPVLGPIIQDKLKGLFSA